MDSQVVVMTLANEHYGVDISAVAEIIKLQPVTFVPRAPAFVEGVTNLRGKVLPVIDLRKRFGLAVATPGKETRIVVVEMAGTQVGMIVDAVSEVLRVPESGVEPPSPIVSTVDSAFISGIAKAGSRLIILLDLEQILKPREQLELQQALLPANDLPRLADVPAASTAPPRPADVPAASTAPPRPADGPAASTAPPRPADGPAASVVQEKAPLDLPAESVQPKPVAPAGRPRGKKGTRVAARK